MEAPDASAQLERLARNAAEVIPREELLEKLSRSVATERPLRVKLGLDPTAADVTLGWAVVLRKLREFQDLGHTAVLIVGDFTARVGDPSGKSETRPRLEADVVRGYAQRLLDQFSRIVSQDRLEVRYNSEWLESLSMEEVLRLTASYTVARMLERDDFAKRFAEQRPISVMEFLYPLLQARDSVAVEADVELGGTDQTFNLLVGREIQRDFGQEAQVVFTMPLLEGLDGVQKMSQSLGNYVGITEPPEEMFGKLMSIPDELTGKYVELCTDVDVGALVGLHPNEAKRTMARAVVAVYRGEEAARLAEERFDLVHREHRVPDDVPEAALPATAVRDGRVWLPRLLRELGLVASNSEGRRQMEQGGVRIDGRQVTDPSIELTPEELRGRVIQVGSRRFARIGG
jgi:tyrosyl-tRNA synthetase